MFDIHLFNRSFHCIYSFDRVKTNSEHTTVSISFQNHLKIYISVLIRCINCEFALVNIAKYKHMGRTLRVSQRNRFWNREEQRYSGGEKKMIISPKRYR